MSLRRNAPSTRPPIKTGEGWRTSGGHDGRNDPLTRGVTSINGNWTTTCAHAPQYSKPACARRVRQTSPSRTYWSDSSTRPPDLPARGGERSGSRRTSKARRREGRLRDCDGEIVNSFLRRTLFSERVRAELSTLMGEKRTGSLSFCERNRPTAANRRDGRSPPV